MKTTLLLSLLLAVLPVSTTLQAGPLADKVAKDKTEWMIGKWATEDGNVSISYTWKLDKSVVAVAFKLGDREAEGMIVQKGGLRQSDLQRGR